MKKALITGISGQDGSYLSEFLHEKGYEIHGIIRPDTLEDRDNKLKNITGDLDYITLHTISLENYWQLADIFKQIRPDECYHLASPSYVNKSFYGDETLNKINFNCTNDILSIIKEYVHDCRFFFAASSEMFGYSNIECQDENTPISPMNLYGLSKANGYFVTKYFRENFGIHSSCGFLYNHESPRRGLQFVTRKITHGAAKIINGKNEKIELRNLSARRDWGDARDFVEAIWLMMQNDNADDYIIATGELHSIEEILEIVFNYANLDWKNFVIVKDDNNLNKEKGILCGNPKKLIENVYWKRKRSFNKMIIEMLENDIDEVRKR